MFRLAHLSDIHLAPMPPISLRELLSKRITGYLNWKGNRSGSLDPHIVVALVAHIKASAPDHIAVTGDLVNLGLEAEFSKAALWLRELGDPSAVTAICGNHDAYVPGALRQALSAWQAYAQGDNGDRVTGTSSYPVLRRRGDISIIACNSGQATPPFMAVGRMGRSQGRRLGAMLEAEGRDGRFRVVLIHHAPVAGVSPGYKRLVDEARFRRIVREQGAELVLHGHTHVDNFNFIDGRDGAVPVVGVPAAGQAPGGFHPAARYNLFTMKRQGEGWSLRRSEHGYSAAGQGIVQLSDRPILPPGGEGTASEAGELAVPGPGDQ